MPGLTSQWTRFAAREAAALSTLEPPAGPLVCRMIFDELCVLATGEIVCSCADPGGRRVYGNVYRDRIAEVFNGTRYRGMRRAQLAAPASSYCPVIGRSCAGRNSRPSATDGESGRVVRVLQLEPIARCNLSCPECPVTHFGRDSRYGGERAGLLPLPTMLEVVDQLPDLDRILFYNFGEPFLHPGTLDFLRTVRQRRPKVALHTSTNGLVLTPETVAAIAGEALLDRIVFSIDGAREASYRRYRVGGSLARALSVLDATAAACRRHGTACRVEVVWQYILFDWNDSEWELEEACRLAAEIGVPIQWVATHTRGASRRSCDPSPGLAVRPGAPSPFASDGQRMLMGFPPAELRGSVSRAGSRGRG